MSQPNVLSRAKKRHAFACIQANRLGEALTLYQKMCETDPQDAEAWFMAGTLYGRSGRFAEAEAALRKAVDLQPDFAQAYFNLGHALELQGKLTEAETCYGRAVALKPELADGRDALARLHQLRTDPQTAAAGLEALLNEDTLAAERRRQIHFELGELYDRQGEYGKAFTHLQAGNALRTARFDPNAWEQQITGLIATFNRASMIRAPRAGNCSERPVFIVGMPHSGTALAERILCMHPEVAAAGELPDIATLAGELLALLGNTVPVNDVTQLSREQCDGLARRYLDMLDRSDRASKRITDRMPQNFLHLGAIALLFPMARVIYCVRDPLDTCLSCYFHDDAGDHSYPHDLAGLGFYYGRYRRLMDHWCNTLDIPILKLSYEQLVREPHVMAKTLAKFCGLKWDKSAAMADFSQIQPLLHEGPVGQWRNYAAYLEPLKRMIATEGPRHSEPSRPT